MIPEKPNFELWFHRYEVIGERLRRDSKGFESGEAIDTQSGNRVFIRRAPVRRFSNHERFQYRNQLRLISEVASDCFWSPSDWGESEGFLYCVQDSQDISSLSGFLDRYEDRTETTSSLVFEDAIQVAQKIARTLQEIHGKGCILGTLQPDHVFYNGVDLLLNCPGPADFVQKSDNPQELQFVKYASPELLGAIGEDVGPPSDLYSLGVLLYRILAGRLPFEAANVGEVIFQHLTQEPNLECLGDVPDSLRRIVESLLQKEPHQRYQSAHAVAHDFNQLSEALDQGVPLDSIVVRRADTRSSIQDPQLVGREEELELLGELLDQTAEGNANAAAVIGSSGIGKTRVVTELLRDATRKGFAVFQGRATDQAGQMPAESVLQIVDQLTRIVESDSQLAHRVKFELASFQSEIATVAPDLAEALGWEANSLAGPDELGAGRVNKALSKVLSLLGNGKPTLIWLDDCHWLDSHSLDVLETFQPQPNQLLILTMRPDEGVSSEVLERVSVSPQLTLQSLNESEVQALVESMAGLLPAEVVQTVVQLSAGSPFMASAILRGIAESGGMEFKGGTWRAVPDKLADIQASSCAAEALLKRLEKVPLEVLSQLSIAAVIGKEFDSQTLVELSEKTFEETQANFEWCRKQRLVWAMPNGEFAFVHDSIRETLIRYLSEERRKALHRDLAELLERNEPHRQFEIAHHFAAAGDNRKALPYAIPASETARDQFSLEAARTLLDIAYEGVEDSETTTKYEIETGLAEVLMLDGDYEGAGKWFEKAAENAYDSITKARTAMKRGELQFKIGNKENAVSYCETAVHALGKSIPSSTAGLAVSLLGQVATQVAHSVLPKQFLARRGAISETQEIYCRVMGKLAYGYWFTHSKYHLLWAHLANLNTAEKYEPTLLLGQAYSDHAPAMSLLPWNSRAIQFAKKSLAIRRQLNDVWGQGQTRDFYSIVLYSASMFESSIDQAKRAVEILSRTGDQWEVNIALYQWAASRYRMGDLAGALKMAKRVYKSSKEVGDYQSTGNVLDLWVRAGLEPIPADILELERSRELRDYQSECQVAIATGVNAIWKQDYNYAIEIFEAAIKSAREGGVCNTYIMPNYVWLVTALRLQLESRATMSKGLRQLAVRKILKAARTAVRKSRPFKNDLPHALRELGIAYALSGKTRKVRATLEESLEVARSQSAKYEAALTREAMGKLGLEFGWQDASELLEIANEQLQEIRQPVVQQHKEASLSLLDRFDSLLDAGREISVAIDRQEIIENTKRASEKLLRGQRNLLILAEELNSNRRPQVAFDKDLCREAMKTGETILSGTEMIVDRGESVSTTGAFLCSPITVQGETIGCLYVANDFLSGLFGDDEIRIAEYLTSAAGAALEKANGFQELEVLNQTLEQKVHERTMTIEARSTELEQTANQLMQTQEQLELARDAAESANEAKSSFLARMSHEIRTPISAVLGFTDLMLRGVVQDPREQKEKLKTIHASGKHLLQLINDLLDISKIEANKMDVERIPCEPGKIVYDVLQSLDAKAQEKSIELYLQIDKSIPRTIESDPTRLRQILTNLVGNAIKFTHEGRITVTMSVDQGGQFVFEITDTGIGMTEEQIKKIFDPFSQADSSTTRKYGGTGLGLSISKTLAEALGGGVEVTSAPGQGSTFTVRVGLGELEESVWLDASSFEALLESSAAEEWGQIDLQGLRALIVDDSETNRDLLSIVLKEAGVVVDQVENGLLACEFIARHEDQIDVVLMDMQMPVLDGYSATTRLRENGFQKPVIALTANSMKGDAEKCLNAGCTDYVSKPIDFEVLLDKLNGLPFERVAKSTIPTDAKTANQDAVFDQDAVFEDHLESEVCPVENQERYSALKIPAMEPFRSLSFRFVDKLFDRLEEFIQAHQSDDFETLGDLAHWVKGTGGTVGINALTEIATPLEQACKAKDKDASGEHLNRLLSLFSETTV